MVFLSNERRTITLVCTAFMNMMNVKEKKTIEISNMLVNADDTFFVSPRKFLVHLHIAITRLG